MHEMDVPASLFSKPRGLAEGSCFYFNWWEFKLIISFLRRHAVKTSKETHPTSSNIQLQLYRGYSQLLRPPVTIASAKNSGLWPRWLWMAPCWSTTNEQFQWLGIRPGELRCYLGQTSVVQRCICCISYHLDPLGSLATMEGL